MEQGKNSNTPLIASILAFFTGFIGPLIMFFVVDKNDKRGRAHIKNVLNFQFSYSLYVFVSAILIFLLIGIILLPIVLIANFIFLIILIVKTNEDKIWKVPLSINFFSLNYEMLNKKE